MELIVGVGVIVVLVVVVGVIVGVGVGVIVGVDRGRRSDRLPSAPRNHLFQARQNAGAA